MAIRSVIDFGSNSWSGQLARTNWSLEEELVVIGALAPQETRRVKRRVPKNFFT
jgi:hypothetical protein